MNKIFFPVLLLVLSIFIVSCDKDDDDMVKEPGTLEIEFDNLAVINGVQKQLTLVTEGSADYNLTNGMGQNFNITLLRYYISNIKLEGPSGEVFEDKVSVDASSSKGVYLIDEAKTSSEVITLNDIPAGIYNKITFTVGVEENAVKEGAAGGVLDPNTSKMFWSWNSGYIAVKFEGQSSVSAGKTSGAETIDAAKNSKGIVYHVGGWKNVDGSAFVNNNQILSFQFDTKVNVEKGEQPRVHMVFDVLKFFKGVNTIDFTGNNNVHKPVDGKPLAQNIPGAFSYDHVHQ